MDQTFIFKPSKKLHWAIKKCMWIVKCQIDIIVYDELIAVSIC